MTLEQKAKPANETMLRKVAVAGAAGTTIELYDFLIFGTASALALNKLFFPAGNPTVGTLLAFATFGAGFLVRPLGAIVIGHFGDRIGRKPMLVLTLTVTGVCTALIGVLPTYAHVGVLAPVLLVILRLLQGFFLGGEQSGAALIVVEYAPRKHRTYYGGWTFIGSPAGIVLGTLVFSLATALSGSAFLNWGWRIPFLFSLVLVVVGLYARLRIEESPEFTPLRAQGRIRKLPILDVLRTSTPRILLGAGVNLGFNAFIFVLANFVLSYGTANLHLPRQSLLNIGLIGGVAQILAILLFTRLADRIRREPVMLGGALFLVVFAFPLFLLVDTRSIGLVGLAVVIGYAGSAAIFGPMAAYYAELFDTRVRYTGGALSYQLGAVLGGGFSPLIATALLGVDHGHSWPIALYLLLAGLVSTICLVALRRLTRPTR
jgi:MFS transporter, MHS family, shikimate and dehydroshikimate transport protein